MMENKKQKFSVGGKRESLATKLEKFSNSDIFIQSDYIIKPDYIEKANNGRGYINWGTDNNFPQELINILAAVPEHNAACKKYVDLTAGQGINVPATASNIFRDFLANKYGTEPIVDVITKMAWDLNLFGGYALEVVWAKNGKNIAYIKHVQLQNLRYSTNEDGWYYSSNWLKPSRYKPVFIPKFNPEKTKEQPNQIYFSKQYFPGTDVYCLPSYWSGMNWILLEYNIGLFHLSNIRSGFKPSLIFSFGFEPEIEIQDQIEEKLKERYYGSENAGEVILLFGADKDNLPEIKEINPNSNDKQYQEMIDIVTQKIMSAWRIPDPSILGIPTPKGFNNGNELLINEYRLQVSVINQLQSFIEKDLNYLASFNNIYEPIALNKYMDEEKLVNLIGLYEGAAEETAAEEDTQDNINNKI